MSDNVSTFYDEIDARVSAVTRRAAAAIEQACEAALQTGTMGVSVTYKRGQSWLMTASPDPSVAYGTILYRELA